MGVNKGKLTLREVTQSWSVVGASKFLVERWVIHFRAFSLFWLSLNKLRSLNGGSIFFFKIWREQGSWLRWQASAMQIAWSPTPYYIKVGLGKLLSA